MISYAGAIKPQRSWIGGGDNRVYTGARTYRYGTNPRSENPKPCKSGAANPDVQGFTLRPRPALSPLLPKGASIDSSIPPNNDAPDRDVHTSPPNRMPQNATGPQPEVLLWGIPSTALVSRCRPMHSSGRSPRYRCPAGCHPFHRMRLLVSHCLGRRLKRRSGGSPAQLLES